MDLQKRISELKKFDLNCNLFSVYDYNGLTMQELLCQFFTKINECVDVSNGTLDLAQWLVNEGLSQEVAKKLVSWLNDGTLENLINETLFSNLNTKINDISYLITPSGGDDSLVIQKAIDDGYTQIKLLGELNCETEIQLKSNISLYGDSSTKIKSNAPTLFYIPSKTSKITIENLEIYNLNRNNDYCIEMIGGTGELFEDSVNNVLIKNVKILDFITAMKLFRVRQVNLENVSIHGKNGIEYTHKSAEVNVINSYIVHYHKENSETFGIKCYSDGENYPEGLTVTNTLIFQFENNLLINDLYVGNFTNCHMDSLASYCKNNVLMGYTNKNERVSFNDCWLIGRGIQFGEDGYSSPKTFRSSINNCKFDEQKGESITFKLWSSQVSVYNSSLISNNIGDDRIAISRVGNNDYIKLSNLTFMFYQNYIIFNGGGVNNNISNIMGNSNKKYPIYVASPVNIDNIGLCDGLSNSYKELKEISFVAGGTIATLDNIGLTSGVHKITAILDNSSITTHGHLKLSFTANDKITPLGSNLATETYCYVNVGTNQHIEVELYISVKEPTRGTFKLSSDNCAGACGFFSLFKVHRV